MAVTKALTAVDPDHPELAAARRAGLAVEPWQQLIADAAATAGCRLVAVAGTHGKSTSSGWLVHVLAQAGATRRRSWARCCRHRSPAASPRRRGGGGATCSSWRRTSTRATSIPTCPSVAVVLNAEWDHPDVFADEAAVLDAFEGWLRAIGAQQRTLVANVGDAGVARLVERLGDWPGTLVRVGLEPRFRRRAGRRRDLRRRSPVHRGPRGRVGQRGAGRARPAQRRQCVVRRGGRGRPGRGPRGDRGRARDVRRRRPAAGGQGRARGRAGARRLRPPPDGHRGHHGRGPRAISRAAAVGGLRAAHVPSHRGDARRVRGRAGGCRSGGHRRHLGRPRPGHEPSRAPPRSRTRSRARSSEPATAPGSPSRRPPITWPARVAAGRRGAGDGRRPVVRHRGAAGRAVWAAEQRGRPMRRAMPPDARRRAGPARPLQGRLGAARPGPRGRPVQRGRRVPADPFEPPLVGANAIREYWNEAAATQANVEFDAERVWVGGRTVLASWHGAFTRRATAERVRDRGFMTLELDDERARRRASGVGDRALRGRGWDVPARAGGGRDGRRRWQVTSRSTWSATSTARSW